MDTKPMIGLTLLLGVVGGLIIASMGVPVIGPSSSTPSGNSVPSYSYTTTTSCVDGSVPSAWIGNVPLDDHVLIVFNETYAHETAVIDVNATIESDSDNEYILRITTSTDSKTSERKGTPPTRCQPTTTVQVSMDLPQNYETLTIIRDNTILTTLTNNHTTDADFRPLNTSRRRV
jgi:hypothetical protein